MRVIRNGLRYANCLQLLYASGFLFMGATEEQMQLLSDSGVTHVSYILILYSIAFLLFLCKFASFSSIRYLRTLTNSSRECARSSVRILCLAATASACHRSRVAQTQWVRR